MTDISKEAVERLALVIEDRAPYCTKYDQERAALTLRALSARIEELEAQVAAARNEALREAAEMCRRTTMEVPMKHQRGKLGGLYAAGEAFGDGFHEGMGYADAILALMEEPTND